VKVSNEDLQKQAELTAKIVAQVSEIHEAVEAVRDVRAQIRGLSRRFGEDSRFAPVLSSAKEFDKKSLDVEGQLLQVNAKSSESTLNFPVLIDERLHSLLFSVDASDDAPTEQQYQVFEELQKQSQPLLAQVHDLMSKDLVALNDMINKQNVPVLYVAPGKQGQAVKAASGKSSP
jgi:cell division protein FtsB